MRKVYSHFRKIIFLGLLYFIPYISFAQTDSTTNDYQKAFNDFNKSINVEFDQFKSKNDSIFYEFLELSWKSFKLTTTTRPSFPKPVIQPVRDTAENISIEIIPSKRKTMLQDSGRQLILNGKPASYNKKNTITSYTTFNFYGTDVSIPKQNITSRTPSNITNKEIALFFKESSSNDELLATIEFLNEQANNKNLNGWGYLQLLKAASEKIYSNSNNQVLFIWLALIKSGYDAKVGYGNNVAHLLVSFDSPIFYNSYFELNGNNYYLVLNETNKADFSSIRSYEANYPGDVNKMTLSMKNAPSLNIRTKHRDINYKGEIIKLSYNANLTDYYKYYPECDLSIYFPPPLSDVALKSISDYIGPHIEGKSNEDKINVLLDFVQNAIAYKTDEEQFGQENYLFAEETISYPFADCEDRSVLLSQLIKKFIGLKTAAIIYPGHVSVGVMLNENIKGSYVECKDYRYYIADPTYIGAKLGMVMPEYADTSPEIIEF